MENVSINYPEKGKCIEEKTKDSKVKVALNKIKKRKQELRLERIRLEKLKLEKENNINEQFKIASEKYKMLLDAGKITQELYDSRIENMKKAIESELADVTNLLKEIKKEYSKLDEDEGNIKNKLEELENQEEINNETREVLSSTNSVKDNIVNADEKEKKEDTEIIIVNISMFNELYKKIKKGTITDNEMNALVKVLEDANCYDKYEITTGIVFNKAKKILKYQGEKIAKNIETFIEENGFFSENIKFDISIERDSIISHTILNSWKSIDEKLTYTDAVFSVEKYIEQIQEYKSCGNKLDNTQEQILSYSNDLKKQLISYRKAINTTEDVRTNRNNKTHKSLFYHI